MASPWSIYTPVAQLSARDESCVASRRRTLHGKGSCSRHISAATAAAAAAGVCKTSTPGDIKEGMAPSAPRKRGGEMPFQFRHASEFAKKTPLLINLRLKL